MVNLGNTGSISLGELELFGFFKGRKAKKKYDEAMLLVVQFGFDAGLDQSDIERIISSALRLHQDSVYKFLYNGGSSIDAAVVIADLTVKVAEERLLDSYDSSSKFRRTVKDLRENSEEVNYSESTPKTLVDLLLNPEVIVETARHDFSCAEKLQAKAFTEGNKLGAKIVMEFGPFGREVSEKMAEFTKK